MNSAPEVLPEPEISIHRAATIRMLRRYFNMSVELGRLPSMMGREVFRSRVPCRPSSFEDFVLYVLDIERCVHALRRPDQELITRVILQEYTQEEAARVLGRTVISIERRLPEVLDLLSERFLELGLLKLPHRRRVAVVEPAAIPEPTADIREVVDIFAAAENPRRKRDSVSIRNEHVQDFSHELPVEIFLSSPLYVTNPANCHVP
jgi:hypothetical protein